MPLLCAAICLLSQAGIGELPRRKSEILQKLVEMLVHRRDEERLTDAEKRRFGAAMERLRQADKLVLLERLARLTFDRDPETPELPRSDAVSEVGEGLEQLPSHCRELDPASVLDLLAERSGVLRGVGPDSLGFVHNLLRVWLAAGRFCHEGHKLRPLVEAALAADDRDLVPLTAARADPATRGRLVDYLLERAERPKEKAGAHRLRLWALRARETREIRERELDERLRALDVADLAPRDAGEARELAELGEAALPYLDRREGQTDEEAAAAVHCLCLIGGDKARARSHLYLDHDSWNVVGQLVFIVDNPIKIRRMLVCLTEGAAHDLERFSYKASGIESAKTQWNRDTFRRKNLWI